MPIRETQLVSDQYYHLFNRGANRQPIFFRSENWDFFLKRLRKYAKPELVDVVAYCLMPNHFHLLVHLKNDRFGAKVMQPFTLSYVRAVNKQEGRTGSLFDGPFKSRHIDRDEYLRHLTRYIHLNPVTAGLVSHPADWVFSSYRDYVGLRGGTLPQPGCVLDHFPSRQAYRSFVLSVNDHQLPSALLID